MASSLSPAVAEKRGHHSQSSLSSLLPSLSPEAHANYELEELRRNAIAEVRAQDSAHYRDPSSIDLNYELDKRRKIALAEVDNASFSWFHVKVCAVAGVGFFTDAYDIFAINIASTMLGYVYGSQQVLTPNQDLGIKVATPIGSLFGQLLFGWLADVVGRKRMYGIELIIIIMGSFTQALAGHGPGVSIIAVLILWRFLMGIGIGGDYPLSAVISSEFAATRTRGRLMTAVFAFQGWGTFAASLVSLIVVSAFKQQIIHDDPLTLRHVDYCWRLLIGIGCVPGVFALYFRLTIPESPRFTMDIERNVQQASQDIDTVLTTGDYYIAPDAVVQRAEAPRASRRDFAKYFRRWENATMLFGAAYSWFALDVVFYGLGLNSANILTTIGFGTVNSTGNLGVYQNLRNVSVGNLILSVAGLIPGYWVSFLFIDTWGRKPIQLMGFAMLTIIFIIMGFAYDALNANHNTSKAFVFLYCLASFFENFGPNVTTFVIPGELFPTRYRSTAHGISAASGKFGAVIAQIVFARVKSNGQEDFLKLILKIFALFTFTGIFSTLLLPETKGKTLEELSNESQEGFIQSVRRAEVRNGIVVSDA
ncbi:MFS general substrate transporter [Artomyces pyxidatus]|uniref:MFS general substrate transporter n=1 Tax=Artomyces pyxidatus TaxID=48021 RepID=A0ACB8T0E6_9AGAM|nr:MFS general substrate transporter [Artomyces pyxidatus]